MNKTLQIIGMVTGMAAAVASSSFVVFKWMDNVQDTGKTHTVQINEQFRQDSLWQAQMMEEFSVLKCKVDSSIAISLDNQKAIHQNRTSYLRHVKSDTSISKEDIVLILEPFMEELKKNTKLIP